MLAMLYMAGGDGERAKKAVDFGLKALQYQGVKDGYVLALLRGRLKSDIAAGEAKRAYDQAEKLHARANLLRPANSSPRSARPIRRTNGVTPPVSASGSAMRASTAPPRPSIGGRRSSSRSRPPDRGEGRRRWRWWMPPGATRPQEGH